MRITGQTTLFLCYARESRLRLFCSLLFCFGVLASVLAQNKPISIPFLADTAKSKAWKTGPKIAGFRSIFKLNGTASMESYSSSFQNPRNLSEAKYIRFSSYSNVSIFTLPFVADVYYTTEKNSLFNSNHFSIRFDKQSFEQSLTQKYQQNLKVSKQELDYTQYQTALLDKSKAALEQQKASLAGKQAEYKTRLEDQLEKEKNQQLKKGRDSLDLLEDEFKNKGLSYRDSLQQKRERVQTKMEQKRLAADTHRLAKKYRLVSKKLDSVHLKYQKYREKFSEDSAKMADFIQAYNDPVSKAGLWLGAKKESGMSRVLSAVNDFSIGNFISSNHALSTFGLNARGLQTKFSLAKAEVGLDVGKAMANDLSSYQRSNGSFDRNAVAVRLDYPIHKKLNSILFAHHIFDPKQKRSKDNKQAWVNSVYGLELNYLVLKQAAITINAAKSAFDVSNRIGIDGEVDVKPYIHSFQSQSAYDFSIQSEITKTTELDATYSFVGPKYRNLGNPFMRVNFLEYKAKLKQGWIKNQIKTAVFYKQLSDNPMKINETTNTTSGYGFSVQSRFKNRKLPNFTFQISPYEQGNNHPDSLFRVNNQFQLMMGGMSYFTQIKAVGINAGIFGSNSVSQLSDSFLAGVHTISGNVDFTLGQKLAIGSGFTAVRSKPFVDSSHVNIYQCRVHYALSRNARIGTEAFLSDYASGSYRKGVKLQGSYATKKGLSITLQTGYDRYFKLWGIDNAEAWSGLLKLQQRF